MKHRKTKGNKKWFDFFKIGKNDGTTKPKSVVDADAIIRDIKPKKP